MKEKLKKQKGITLVALVITIIVLLILAMVSISIVMNQGIMTKSEDAADKYNEAANNEQEELTFFEKLFGKYNGEKTLPKWWDEVESTTNSNGEYWELTNEEIAEIEAAGMHVEALGWVVVAYETEEKKIYIHAGKDEYLNLKYSSIAIADGINEKEYFVYDVTFSEVGVYANKWYKAGDGPRDNPIEYTGEFPIDISEIPEESIYSKTYLKRLVENFNK